MAEEVRSTSVKETPKTASGRASDGAWVQTSHTSATSEDVSRVKPELGCVCVQHSDPAPA